MADRGRAIAGEVRAQGWEQGAVLDFDLHAFAMDPANPTGRIARSFLNRWNQEVSARARAAGKPLPPLPPGLAADYDTLSQPSDVRNRVIIVSQTCDILADADDEPWVEVMRLCRASPDFLERLTYGNSARAFCVDPDARLIAQAQHRTRLDKGVLLTRQAPLAVLPRGERLRERFRLWLGRRFTRPALPDDLDHGFRVVLEEMLRAPDATGKTHAAAYGACAEIRHRIGGARAPYRVDLVFLTPEPPSPDLRAAVHSLVGDLAARLDPRVVSDISGEVMSYSEVSAQDYLSTQPFLLDYFTHTDTHAVPPGSERM